MLRREAVVRPHRVGRRRVVLGQVLRALAGGDDLEARGAAPVDHLADQRRLVAVRERIDDAGLARALREQRAGERVGLDVDHHDVLAVRAARERVADARGRIAGRVDDDLDLGRGDQRGRVVGDVASCRCLRRVGDRARGVALGCPAGARQRRARALGREVGDRRRRGCPACASPARDTSSRTCRRRSARRAAACPPPRAPASRRWRFMASVPGRNASSASAARTPCDADDAPRGDAEPRGGVDVDRVVVDEQHVLGARAERIEHVLEIVGVRLEACPTTIRRKVVVELRRSSDHVVAEALPVDLVGVRDAREAVAAAAARRAARSRRGRALRGHHVKAARNSLGADGQAELGDRRPPRTSSRPMAPVSKRRTAGECSQRRHSSSSCPATPGDHASIWSTPASSISTPPRSNRIVSMRVLVSRVNWRLSACRRAARGRAARTRPTARCRSARSTRPSPAPAGTARRP